jgi:hypothetical protein
MLIGFGWMQVGLYAVGETPNIDRIGREGARFNAELHVRTQCLLHRHVSAAHRREREAADAAVQP